MGAAENKELMQEIFARLSKGDGKMFRDSMAEDFRWTLIGTTRWSGTYEGRRAVIDNLLRPLSAQFVDQYTSTAHRIIAEDDYVVVECRGRVTTNSGKPYHNCYCWVCRLADGKLRELTEYMDTELVATVLGPPEPSTEQVLCAARGDSGSSG
jgi:ketosteroid isomerase-like protein